MAANKEILHKAQEALFGKKEAKEEISTVGQFIKQKRKELGFTQEQLAHAIGIHRPDLAKMETNQYPINDRVIERLTKFKPFQSDVHTLALLIVKQKLPETLQAHIRLVSHPEKGARFVTIFEREVNQVQEFEAYNPPPSLWVEFFNLRPENMQEFIEQYGLPTDHKNLKVAKCLREHETFREVVTDIMHAQKAHQPLEQRVIGTINDYILSNTKPYRGELVKTHDEQGKTTYKEKMGVFPTSIIGAVYNQLKERLIESESRGGAIARFCALGEDCPNKGEIFIPNPRGWGERRLFHSVQCYERRLKRIGRHPELKEE